MHAYAQSAVVSSCTRRSTAVCRCSWYTCTRRRLCSRATQPLTHALGAHPAVEPQSCREMRVKFENHQNLNATNPTRKETRFPFHYHVTFRVCPTVKSSHRAKIVSREYQYIYIHVAIYPLLKSLSFSQFMLSFSQKFATFSVGASSDGAIMRETAVITVHTKQRRTPRACRPSARAVASFSLTPFVCILV
jgi:hypothetical protein